MRIRSQLQQYFKFQSSSSNLSKELEKTSQILESLPDYNELLELVLSDLQAGTVSDSGRKGMTSEQVLRCIIVRQRKGFSYRDLSESTKDSICIREFLKIGPREVGFNFKTIQGNIKRVKEETLDRVNESLKRYAEREGIEDGSMTRTDATAIEADIHHPTDWSLMHDCILVLSRIMTMLLEFYGVPIKFQNHFKASKSKLFQINNCRNEKKKRKLIMQLIRLCEKTVLYANRSLSLLEADFSRIVDNPTVKFESLVAEMKRVLPLAETIVDVAHRRIVKKEAVPSSDKIFSIFEPHTDIIIKGCREVIFGHKSTITTGKSGMILDVIVHEGNPADSTIVPEIIERHKKHYKKAPDAMVFDGSYQSNDNRELLQNAGVGTISFTKEKNIPHSTTTEKCLRFFRSGIEASISMLKRMFGWTRVMDEGWHSFVNTLKAGAIAYNLFLLARVKLKA